MKLIRALHIHPAVYFLGAFFAGTLCTRFVPDDWFLRVLGGSTLIAFVFAVLARISVLDERKAPAPIAVALSALNLPSSNGKIKQGLVLSLFLAAASFLAGMLLSAISLGLG